jgi:GcrA cell cycle regulator
MALWGEGLPTSEIGRRLGVTKNAVVGKVHRLGLPKRNSPIKAEKKAPAPKEPPKSDEVQLDNLRPGMCRWPEGEPGTESFYFCGQPVVPEKPYCAHHCERAYVKSTKEKKSSTAAA